MAQNLETGLSIRGLTADTNTLQIRNSSNNTTFIVNNTGNVGIGTSSPSARLDVSGLTRTSSLQITSGVTVGYVLTVTDTLGNTRWLPLNDEVTELPAVISIQSTPPAAVEGDRYLVSGGTGAWTGQNTKIAEYSGVTWVYTTPVLDDTVFVTDTLLTYRFNGTSWSVYGKGVAILQNGNRLGSTINIGSNDNQDLTFRTSASTRVIITKTGNIGVGTGSPSAKLEVSGLTKTTNLEVTYGATITGDLIVSGLTRTTTLQVNSGATISTNLIVSGTTTTSRLRIMSGATAGYILTAIDNLGNTRWLPLNDEVTELAPVISIQSAPPGSNAQGDRYLVSGGTGVWTGQNNNIAEYSGITWVYTTPVLDDTVFVTDTLTTYRYNGTSWIPYRGTAILQNGNRLNATINIGSNDNQDLSLRTSATTRVLITKTGNVGINNFNPLARLDVSGLTRTTTLQITSGATAGYVLTATDSLGNSIWQISTGGGTFTGGTVAGASNFTAGLTASSINTNSFTLNGINYTSIQEVVSQGTGLTIHFSGKTIFNLPTSPADGNISHNLTNAKLGMIQKIYHSGSTVPTVPTEWQLVGEGTYFTYDLNIIYAEYVTNNWIEYWIIQKQI